MSATLAARRMLRGALPLAVITAEEAAATAELFKALSDPARVRIVNVHRESDEPGVRV